MLRDVYNERLTETTEKEYCYKNNIPGLFDIQLLKSAYYLQSYLPAICFSAK